MNQRINKSSKSRRQTLIEIVKDRLEELVDLSKRSYRKLSKVEKTRRDRSEIWLIDRFHSDCENHDSYFKTVLDSLLNCSPDHQEIRAFWLRPRPNKDA